METPSPTRHHRLAWLALAAFGTLLLLPATRYLLRMQIQMEALTYSTRIDPSAEQAAAARLPDDYPVQLALASHMPVTFVTGAAANLPAPPREYNRRIEALTRRFPNNPSVYANLLRYMTRGDMHIRRDDDGYPPIPAGRPTAAPTSAESIAMFEAAAQRGAELDPDNAYFPMMHAVSLLAAHRDSEALEAFKTAGHCSRWTEYYQDELEGLNRLQRAAYGEQGAITHLNNAANILFPQYSPLRTASRVAIHLASEQELAGNKGDMLAVRHAVMRCGGLMRAQGASYITVLVGIALTNIGTADPNGMGTDADLSSAHSPAKETDQVRDERTERRRNRYYSYLENIGQVQETRWAKTELVAGDQAKAIGTEALKNSVFNGQNFFHLGISSLTNLVLLSSTLVFLLFGAAAHLAGRFGPRKALLLWRMVFAGVVVGGIGMWQWHAAQVGMSPYIEIQRMFAGMSEDNINTEAKVLAVQSLTAGLSLLVPVLFVGLIAVIALFQRISLANGVGRGLRGAAFPAAAVLFLVYSASLLPTAISESSLNAEIGRTTRNEPHAFAEITNRAWPGNPQP